MKLDQRLQAVAQFVRQDSVLADIGTDHAYLPIWLLLNHRISKAIAADINHAPLVRAEKNIRRYSCTDRIQTIQTNGLHTLDAYKIDDIAIAGMGAELISAILEDAPFVKNPHYRLILQPMTSQHLLRAYLTKHGFAILEESLGFTDNKIYQILCVQYDGQIRHYSTLELFLGKELIKHKLLYPEIFPELVRRHICAAEVRIVGRKKADLSTLEDETFIEELRGLLW